MSDSQMPDNQQEQTPVPPTADRREETAPPANPAPETAATPSKSTGGTAAGEPAGGFTQAYWMCNCIEMFERLAYFGIRYMVPIYIMQATEPGGLHMTATDKGIVYMVWAILQSYLPMVTGGLADRYGYKKVLFFSISANAVAYLLMAFLHNFAGFFLGIAVLAVGTAFFKPALQGTIAQNLSKKNSSVGWSIFYWVVNIGAVMAPILATILLGRPHSTEGWRNLFIASSIYSWLNLLMLLTFKDVPTGADQTKSFITVVAGTIENIWPYWFRDGRWDPTRLWVGGGLSGAGVLLLVGYIFGRYAHFIFGEGVQFPPDQWELWGGLALFLGGGFVATWLVGGRFEWQPRLAIFLAIMSCFWMMMYQLWDLHPNFIEDWIDSSGVAQYSPWQEYGDLGKIRVPQQILLTLNGAMIVAFVVPIGLLVRKLRTLTCMLGGMAVAVVGILVAGLTGNGWVLLLGVVFFSLGEMLTGPKKNEYLALIAPPEKKGLYLGYVNIPVGVGVAIGSLVAGIVYDNYGEKATLALKELATDPVLVAEASTAVDWSDSLDRLPDLMGIDRDQALTLAAAQRGESAAQTAAYLRDSFHFDLGQIQNLAVHDLAERADAQKAWTAALDRMLKDDNSALCKEFSRDGAKPSKEELLKRSPSRMLQYMPDAIGVSRFDALAKLREARAAEGLEHSNDALISVLWEKYGENPDVLNNLAMEYLAQGTDRLNNKVAAMTFNESDAVEGMDSKVGMPRTKAFAALCAARGASDAEIESALQIQGGTFENEQQRLAVFLVNQQHRRFIAVGQRDWSDDVPMLAEMIKNDSLAQQTAAENVDKLAFPDNLIAWILNRISPPDMSKHLIISGLDYTKLATNQDAIQKALKAKNWNDTPEQAVYLLRLNPFEAKAQVAAEVNHAPIKVTQLLWDTYHPQYKVWLPFAAIGLLATIALGIFGQMAKRWNDMNA